MKKFLILIIFLSGCSITKSTYEIKKESLEKDITILKLELRKIRLEKQIVIEEKEY